MLLAVVAALLRSAGRSFPEGIRRFTETPPKGAETDLGNMPRRPDPIEFTTGVQARFKTQEQGLPRHMAATGGVVIFSTSQVYFWKEEPTSGRQSFSSLPQGES
jgi:hypothetical protein